MVPRPGADELALATPAEQRAEELGHLLEPLRELAALRPRDILDRIARAREEVEQLLRVACPLLQLLESALAFLRDGVVDLDEAGDEGVDLIREALDRLADLLDEPPDLR